MLDHSLPTQTPGTELGGWTDQTPGCQEQIGNQNTEPLPMAIPITEQSGIQLMALPSHPTDGETG